MDNSISYAIYQIPPSDMPHEYFLGEKDVLMTERMVRKYRSVWAGTIEDRSRFQDLSGVLDEIFRIFNTDHPPGYRAHSLSCGDVVGLLDEGRMRYFLCERVGWSEVTDEFELK